MWFVVVSCQSHSWPQIKSAYGLGRLYAEYFCAYTVLPSKHIDTSAREIHSANTKFLLDQSSTTPSRLDPLGYRSMSAVQNRNSTLPKLLLFSSILCSESCHYLLCLKFHLLYRFCGSLHLPLELEYALHDPWRLEHSSHCRLGKVVSNSFHCRHPLLIFC